MNRAGPPKWPEKRTAHMLDTCGTAGESKAFAGRLDFAAMFTIVTDIDRFCQRVERPNCLNVTKLMINPATIGIVATNIRTRNTAGACRGNTV